MSGRRGNQRARRGGGGRGGRGGIPESVRDRLGNMPVYPRQGNTNVRGNNRYKLVNTNARQGVITSSITKLPDESKIKSLPKRFLRSYYEIFDQPGQRSNLESLYSADAFFSFSATYPTLAGRNLLEVREPNDRLRLLIHNKTNITSALATFAPTEHLVDFLSIDIPFYTINPMSVVSMQIVVTGVLKDTSSQTDPLRAFTRVFVLKQASVDKEGEPVYEIFNDLFMLQPPTPDQIKKYHHEAQLSRKSSSNQQDRPNSSTASGDLTTTQVEKLRSIMTKTKMNMEGSMKLLKEAGWDENQSMAAFNTLQAANKIPQQFFAL